MKLTPRLALALTLALIALPGTGRVAGAESRLTLLDFHADWCGPCRQMRPAMDRLAEKGYPIKSVNVDQERDLVARYQISNVPTFVVVDAKGRELARTSGLQPASQLAALYHEAHAKARAAASSSLPASTRTAEDERDRGTNPRNAEEESQTKPDAESQAEPDATTLPPKPWETGVRIKTYAPRSIGFGSGTVIHSTEKVSIILTCAHIFDMEGRKVAPSQYNRRVVVDLFDGQLHGTHPAMVHPLETEIPAQVIDYDFNTDVGLIAIRPGRKLKASPIVPPDWKPVPGLKMNTVGCSEGNNATAWTTQITNPRIQGLMGRARYEAIECQHAPRQGRSGGGLFTLDGYLAGVCDFAEPIGRHGLYATPRSIYTMLDKHQLTFCYNPTSTRPESLLADSGGRSRRAPAAEPTKLRAQNSGLSDGKIPMPEPGRLGVTLGPIAQASGESAPGQPVKGWQARGGASTVRKPVTELAEETRPVDHHLNARFAEAPPPAAEDLPIPDEVGPARKAPRGGWKAVQPSTSLR